jgi:hypothetical protein
MIYYPNKTGEGRLPPQNIPTASRQAAVAVNGPPVGPPSVQIGNQSLPVRVPALDPAQRPLLNASPRPLNPNLQPAPIPQRAPLPLPGTAPAPGSVNPVTLLPNPNPSQVINREP